MKQELTTFQKKLKRKYKTKYKRYKLKKAWIKLKKTLRKPYGFWKQNHLDNFEKPRIQKWSTKYYRKRDHFVAILCNVFGLASLVMCVISIEYPPIENPSRTSASFPNVPNDNSNIERNIEGFIQESCLGNFEEELGAPTKIVRRVDGSSVSTVDRFKELRLKDSRVPSKSQTNNIQKLQEQLAKKKETNQLVEAETLDPAEIETIADKNGSKKIAVKKVNGTISRYTTVEEIKTRQANAKQRREKNQVSNLHKLNQKDFNKKLYQFTAYENFLIRLAIAKARNLSN